MSISLTLHADDLDEALVRLDRYVDFKAAPLMEALASLGESQTRRRIESEKTAPDGSAWPENAEDTPILRRTGRNLLDSVASHAGSDLAEWGAAWEFAHVHQDGMTIVPKHAERLAFTVGGQFVTAKEVTIPARPFVGISAANRDEILDLVTDWFGIGGPQ